MYNLKAGSVLMSTALLNNDDWFAQAVLLVAEYSEANGALAFVINQPFGRNINELEAYRHIRPFALYRGGPVETDQLYCLHTRPDLVADSQSVGHGWYMGGQFDQLLKAWQEEKLALHEFRCTIGYCGWDAHQLEAEMDEGSWLIREAAATQLLASPADEMWEKLLLQ